MFFLIAMIRQTLILLQVITGDMGVKYYGMVITTLEELTISHSSELIEAMSEWREKNLVFYTSRSALRGLMSTWIFTGPQRN